MTVETLQVPAYRLFRGRVARARRLSPSFLRVTVTGDELVEFASNGYDQRIKVVLPLPGRGLDDCPEGPDWYAEWRALPPERRNPLRTYTVRAARPLQQEIDVDFVLHGGSGPASAWAEQAASGDEVALIGPDARFPGPTGGFEWRPPVGASSLLLAGDETAAPAICAIAEGLPTGVRAQALLEVPTSSDVLDVDVPDGVRVTWLPRRHRTGASPLGELLTAAVAAAVEDLGAAASPGAGPEHVEGDDLLWEVPPGDAVPERPGAYAWLAGEAGMVTGLRRRLLRDAGFDRASVAFMGYWRLGRDADS